MAAVAVFLIILIILVAFVPFPSNLPYPHSIRWAVIAAIMLIFVAAIAKILTKNLLGILIDEYNKMSLSRLQIVIWTIIVVSAYFTIASIRLPLYDPINNPDFDPLAISIDWQLWALLGISSASLVGTPLISNYKNERAEQKWKEKMKFKMEITNKAEVEFIDEMKPLRKRSEVGNAKFTDIFKFDEESKNAVDMSKVQMFFFTIIAAIVYLVMLVSSLNATTIPEELPVLSEGLIALLTISHGAYLTNKSVPRTST